MAEGSAERQTAANRTAANRTAATRCKAWQADLLAQDSAGWGTDVQVTCELIGKLLRLRQQAGVQELENEAPLLGMALPHWLEKAEQHQVCVDLQ